MNLHLQEYVLPVILHLQEHVLRVSLHLEEGILPVSLQLDLRGEMASLPEPQPLRRHMNGQPPLRNTRTRFAVKTTIILARGQIRTLKADHNRRHLHRHLGSQILTHLMATQVVINLLIADDLPLLGARTMEVRILVQVPIIINEALLEVRLSVLIQASNIPPLVADNPLHQRAAQGVRGILLPRNPIDRPRPILKIKILLLHVHRLHLIPVSLAAQVHQK